MDGTGEDDDQTPLVPADTPRWCRGDDDEDDYDDDDGDGGDNDNV